MNLLQFLSGLLLADYIWLKQQQYHIIYLEFLMCINNLPLFTTLFKQGYIQGQINQ